MFILDSFLINNIIFSILYSIIITNLIIGALILFSISMLDFNLLSPIKYMFINGVKKVAKGAGNVIIYGGTAAAGAKALVDLRKDYLDYKKNDNGGAGPSNSNNNNSNSNTTPNKNTPTSAKPSNATPSSKPASTPAKSSLLLWALSYLNLNVSENSSDMFKFLSSLLTLELLVLFGFINLVFYFISNIIILKYDIETKFSSPYLKKIIRFYVKSSLYFIIFEIILTLLSILTIILFIIVLISSLI